MELEAKLQIQQLNINSAKVFNRPNQLGSVFYKQNEKIYCGKHNTEMI